MKNIKLIINNDIKKEKEKFFVKKELKCILDLYARMVSNGTWKIIHFLQALEKFHLTYIKDPPIDQF